MKTLKTLILCLLLSPIVFAQNLLLIKKDKLALKYRENNENENYTVKWGFTTDDHQEYVRFDHKSGLTKMYYFDENGFCSYYRLFMQYDLIQTVTERLTQQYFRIDDNAWIEYGKTADYKWSIFRYDDYFVVGCSVYKLHTID